jgi:hypothetical protein
VAERARFSEVKAIFNFIQKKILEKIFSHRLLSKK